MKNAIRKMMMIAKRSIIDTSLSFVQMNRKFKPSENQISCKLEYDIDYDTEKNEIKLNDFQGQDFMITIRDSKSNNFKFSETWDFQLSDEKLVRFLDRESYPLANNGALWIFTKQLVKAASYLEGGQTITTYFLAEVEMDMEVFLN